MERVDFNGNGDDAAATGCRPPIFVLGVQRSGTTMLRLMLNNHPNIAMPHETAFITQFTSRLQDYGDLQDRRNARRLLDDIAAHPFVVRGDLIPDKKAVFDQPITSYADLIDAIMSEYARFLGKPRWGDKTPGYTPEINILWNLFPDAKLIHLIRDGQGVAISQRRIGWCPNNLHLLADDWRWKTVICHKVGTTLGSDRYLELRYEDLVRDSEGTLRHVCRFIGEAYIETMLRYHEDAMRVVPKESLQWHRNSVRAPDPNKVFAWKRELSPSDRVIYDEVAGDALELFGYERESMRGTVYTKMKKAYYTFCVRW